MVTMDDEFINIRKDWRKKKSPSAACSDSSDPDCTSRPSHKEPGVVCSNNGHGNQQKYIKIELRSRALAKVCVGAYFRHRGRGTPRPPQHISPPRSPQMALYQPTRYRGRARTPLQRGGALHRGVKNVTFSHAASAIGAEADQSPRVT